MSVGGGPDVVGTGGSGLERPFIGSLPGVTGVTVDGSPPGVIVDGLDGAVVDGLGMVVVDGGDGLMLVSGCMLPGVLVLPGCVVDCVLVDFPRRLLPVCDLLGAVLELPVCDAVDPAFVDPDVLEPDACPYVIAGVRSAAATNGSTTLPRTFIMIALLCRVGGNPRLRRCKPCRYSTTAYGAVFDAVEIGLPVTCRTTASAITTNSSVVMPAAPKCCHSTGEKADAIDPPTKYAVM